MMMLEHKMMMLEHKDISKIGESADFYRQKVNKYCRRVKEAMPTLDEGGRSGRSSPETDHLLHSDYKGSAAPTEHLDDSFPSSLTQGSHFSAITRKLGTAERSGLVSKTTPTISAIFPNGITSRVMVSEKVSGWSPRIVVYGAR